MPWRTRRRRAALACGGCAGRGLPRGIFVLVIDEPERPGEIGIDLARSDRRLAALEGRFPYIAGLGPFAEPIRRGRARAMGGSEIGAAVARIIRRRLQTRPLPTLPRSRGRVGRG